MTSSTKIGESLDTSFLNVALGWMSHRPNSKTQEGGLYPWSSKVVRLQILIYVPNLLDKVR
jgi:hypothetical protein